MGLPLLAIADLIGVPEADREKLFHWTNAIMNTDDSGLRRPITSPPTPS